MNGKRDESIALLTGALADCVDEHTEAHAHSKGLAGGCVQVLTAYGGREDEIAALKAKYDV